MAVKRYAVFTMDVEAFSDTECVAKSKENIEADLLDGFDTYLEILNRHAIKSTLFTVGSLAPKMTDRLQSAIRHGHRLALHSLHHVAPLEQSVETFKEETKQAKEHLAALFDTEVVGFRAPCFSMDDARLNVLQELGFKYDSSHLNFPAARHTVKLHLHEFKECVKGIFRRNDFYEFALSGTKIFGLPYPISGGGYIRLCHWGVAKYVIRHYLERNEYYVFYVHPFELTSQKIPFIKDLKLYDKYYIKAGIKNYAAHIEQLILMLKQMNYRFITFEELQEELTAQPT